MSYPVPSAMELRRFQLRILVNAVARGRVDSYQDVVRVTGCKNAVARELLLGAESVRLGTPEADVLTGWGR